MTPDEYKEYFVGKLIEVTWNYNNKVYDYILIVDFEYDKSSFLPYTMIEYQINKNSMGENYFSKDELDNMVKTKSMKTSTFLYEIIG